MRRAGVIALLLGTLAHADEIAGPGHRPITGTLVLTGGQLILQGVDGKARAKGADLAFVKLATMRKSFAAGPPHRVLLSGDEQVTGIFLGMQRDTLSLRTAWAQRLAIPRASVQALTHLPGWRTVVHETPSNNKARQSTAVPGVPLPAARVSVLFGEVTRVQASWVVEVEFATMTGARTVRVSLAKTGEVRVDPGGLRGTARTVRRSPHCLTVEHSAGSLRICCDDEVLWYTLDSGPGKLRCVRLAGEAKAVFTEAAEPVHRRPRGNPARDELWLASGDQVFGAVQRADVRGVEIAGKFGTRSYAWKELRGWFPRRMVVPPPAAVKGVKVQLEIDSGLRAEPDSIVGTLTALDAKQAILRHPALGDLTIPRSRIVSVRPLTDR